MIWRRSAIASDGTHHHVSGVPLYAARFEIVQRFHEPGLAPAVDTSGAFHITEAGVPAYPARFLQTWGFYEGLAAAETKEGWCHVLPDGSPLGPHRYAWCGNFQEGWCAVRNHDQRYFHLTTEGLPAYTERYLYVGDFRDGAAVVRCPERGLCTHVGPGGCTVHGRWFADLDVFHKGLARARDAEGWFHVDGSGRGAYGARFAAVEPFYNGTALAETFEGQRILVDRRGRVALTINPPTSDPEPEPSNVQVVVVGNIGAGKTTVSDALAEHFGWPAVGIDSCRRQCGDGSPAGELRSWARFVQQAQARGPRVLEFSGSGPMTHLVRKAIAGSGCVVVVLWVDTPADECLRRIAGRAWDIPYPDFGVPMEAVVRELGERLTAELRSGKGWSKSPVFTLDGQLPEDALKTLAVQHLADWLRRMPR